MLVAQRVEPAVQPAQLLLGEAAVAEQRARSTVLTESKVDRLAVRRCRPRSAPARRRSRRSRPGRSPGPRPRRRRRWRRAHLPARAAGRPARCRRWPGPCRSWRCARRAPRSARRCRGSVGDLAEVDELGRRDRVVEAAGPRPVHRDVVQPHRASPLESTCRVDRVDRPGSGRKRSRPARWRAANYGTAASGRDPRPPERAGPIRRRRAAMPGLACRGSRGRRGSAGYGGLSRLQGVPSGGSVVRAQ